MNCVIYELFLTALLERWPSLLQSVEWMNMVILCNLQYAVIITMLLWRIRRTVKPAFR